MKTMESVCKLQQYEGGLVHHSEGGGQGHGQHGKGGGQGHGQHRGEGDQVGEVEVGVRSGLKRHLAGHVKSYQCLRGRRGYEDFEKNF